MQTGDIQIDGKTYHLNEDGSLKGYKTKKSSGSSSKDKVSSTDQNSDSSEVSGKKDSESPESSKKAVALTFDDGHEFIYRKASGLSGSKQCKSNILYDRNRD